jgi:hypothetical protein
MDRLLPSPDKSKSYGQTGRSSSRTGLLPSSPLRTVHESFPSHGSSPSNASEEARFGNGHTLVMDGTVALWMKQNTVL